MPFLPWLAWRYLQSGRLGRFSSLLTILAILSIAIGTASLIIILSVMRGFNHEVAQKLMGIRPHISIMHDSLNADLLDASTIKSILPDHVMAQMTPCIEGEVIIQSHTLGQPTQQGAKVIGISFDELRKNHPLIFDFSLPDQIEKTPAIIGKDIAFQLGIFPAHLNTMTIIAPLARIGPHGDFVPKKSPVTVVADFKTGIFQLDSKAVFVPYNAAKSMLGHQMRAYWQIRLINPYKASQMAILLNDKLPSGWHASTWISENAKLFAALELERIAMIAIMILQLIIASISIAGVMLLIATVKRTDIGLLKVIGMARYKVIILFLYISSIIGALGASLGFALGTFVCMLLQYLQIPLSSSYYLDALPVSIHWPWSIACALIGIAIAIIAGLYPAIHTYRIGEAQILRYE